MSRAIRTPDEALALEVAELRRIVQDLQRAGAGLVHIQAVSNTDVTVTATTPGTAQDLPGAAITIVRAGLYLVVGIFDLDWTGASAGAIGAGALSVTGGTVAHASVPLLTCLATATRVTISEAWQVTFTGAGSMKLQAYKPAGAGTLVARSSAAGATGVCKIVALRTGPV